MDCTNVACSIVCVSVCVGHVDVLCKNNETNRDAILGACSCGPKELCIR